MSDAKKQAETKAVKEAQILRAAFSTPAGIQALEIILKDICKAGKMLPISTCPPDGLGHIAVYFGALKDVAIEITNRMNFTPTDTDVVVKTKRD